MVIVWLSIFQERSLSFSIASMDLFVVITLLFHLIYSPSYGSESARETGCYFNRAAADSIDSIFTAFNRSNY